MFVHFLAPFGDLRPSLSSGLTSQKATKSKPKLAWFVYVYLYCSIFCFIDACWFFFCIIIPLVFSVPCYSIGTVNVLNDLLFLCQVRYKT